MGAYRVENIAGIRLASGLVSCSGCMGANEWDNLLEKEIIVAEEDDIICFCDRCKNRLP